MFKMSERFSLLFLLYLQALSSFLHQVCADESGDEVQIEVLFLPENCTQKAKKGDLLHAHYDGYLAKDGTQFYCSRSAKDGQPHWFVHGVGEIIKGLDMGLKDMCPGEMRKIIVPPSLAFGEKGKDTRYEIRNCNTHTEMMSIVEAERYIKSLDSFTKFINCFSCLDPVPPNATVIFKVELLHVRRGPRSMEAFKEMDLDNDLTLTKEEVRKHLKMEAEKLKVEKEESYFDDVVSDVFRRNDHNADGALTVKEYNVYEHDEL
ncbi:peptidyl-prolyl cis-trans isomerase FKBP7 precursor, partial [Silurus asotus]